MQSMKPFTVLSQTNMIFHLFFKCTNSYNHGNYKKPIKKCKEMLKR